MKSRRQKQRRLSVGGRPELLEARELLTVTYQGGALLTNVEAQAVYLGSDWSTNSSLQTQARATDQFLSTLVNGPYMDMLGNAGYGVGRGSASAGAIDNLSINKNLALTDSQIRSDLEAMLANAQSSGLQAADANRLYLIYVEPGVVVKMGSATSKTSFLGYHGAFGFNGSDIHYAVMPAPGTPNPNPGSQGFGSAFDELTAVSSHELAEAVTDPNVNYKTLGWYDFQLNGEIGDLTRQTSTISGANGTQYLVQDVVDQNDQVISPGTSQPSPTPPPSPGLSAPTLTASAVSSTVAQLSWTAVSGTQGYRVYQEIGGQSVLLGTVSANTIAVQVTGLTPGAAESFMVEAYAGTSVADSSVVSVTTPAPTVQRVTAPQVTAQAASPTSVALSWGAEPQAAGYNIYWSNGYRIVFLGTVDSSTSSLTVTGLHPGSSSFFVVEAFNDVSVADSRWAYVATPSYYTGGNYGAFGQYGHQPTGAAWSGGSAAPGSASKATGSHGARGHCY
ncbi:MAG TPA: fibronectin type III domain-containing protein [Pirellulales bacterium]|jgi:hypothetical protein|nr:fibronectin type III domain-containing protein [Pirellulales bacterium]